jgi:hypothetical protein
VTSGVIHVVGDKFASFARSNPGVVTITELEHMLEGEELQDAVTLVFGQGLQSERLARLQERLLHPRLQARVPIRLEPLPERAAPELVHKHVPHNVMISTPELVSEDTYHASLVLDDRCAELSDHITGQHLQGMVLLEAVRQMCIAVTEQFMSQRKQSRSSFVLKHLESRNHAFAFPLRVSLEFQLRCEKSRRYRSSPDEGLFRIHQGGELVLDGCMKFSAYSPHLFESSEATKARQLVTKLSSQNPDNA